MKRSIICLLLFLPFFICAQQNTPAILILNNDSLARHFTFKLEQNWRFKEADDPRMADTAYDDSKWEVVNPALWLRQRGGKKEHDRFNSIGWFRLHFIADSSICNIPLAISMTHLGASEIYLDGKMLNSFGTIKGRDSSVYIDPHDIPFIYTISQPGHHVLAVRYANYNAQHNNKVYENNFAGFTMRTGLADNLIGNDHMHVFNSAVIFNVLFGIFLALGISHLFIYFYHRTSRSNLYFCIFCLSIAAGFLLSFMMQTTQRPGIILANHFISPYILSFICISLSGFVNVLFSTSKWRFKVIAVSCLLTPIVFYIDSTAGIVTFFVVIAVTMLEAIILIISAMVRRVKGARIIGFGMLLFTFFVFFCVVYLLIFEDISFSDSPVAEAIFSLLAMLAVLSIPTSMALYLAWSYSYVNKQLVSNLQQVQQLSAKSIEQELEKARLIESQNEKLELEVAARTSEVVAQKEKIERQHSELKAEKRKSDELLLNILPEEVAEELKEKGYSEARSFNDVTVLFTDFVNFTKAGERMSAQELVDELHVCFKAFDEIISKHGIEKIKTIGDAYLAVSGLPVANVLHAHNVVLAAQEIQAFMVARQQLRGDKTFEVRIGIHSGSVVAGIVGIKKFAYDIWGDAVNTAARMEQNSEPGRINISNATYELVKDRFNCAYRGEITAKNKGAMKMYFVEQ